MSVNFEYMLLALLGGAEVVATKHAHQSRDVVLHLSVVHHPHVEQQVQNMMST